MSKCFEIFSRRFSRYLERACVYAEWSTGTYIEDGYGVVEGSLSRETDLAEVRIHLAPTFTRFEPRKFLSLGLYERLDQQKKISNEGSSQIDHRNTSCRNSAVRYWRIQPSHSKLYCSQMKIV